MDDHNLRSNLEEEAAPFTPASLDEIRTHIQSLRDQMMASLPSSSSRLSQAQIQGLLCELPQLTEHELTDLGHKDSFCPICMTPYLAIIAEEEIAHAMDSPAHPIEELGVTKLSKPWQCGHIFCRRDISKWIIAAHYTCPMCRRPLVEESPGTEQTEQTELVTDPEGPLFSLERHLEFQSNMLRSLNVNVLGLPHLDSREADLESEDRSQYSGMYS